MGGKHPRLLRHIGLAVVLAQFATLIEFDALTPGLSAAATATSDVPVAPTVLTTLKAASPVAAGAQAVIDVSTWNQGSTALAAPVVLSFHALPSGLTLVGATTRLVGASWKCSPAAATCELVGADGTPVPLAANESATTRVRLAASSSAVIADTVSIDVRLSAGTSSPPADLGAASGSVTLTRLSGQPGSIEVVSDTAGIVAGSRSSVQLSITNLGPAGIGGSEGPITATGVLPVGSTDWTATGTGWSCTAVSGLPKCAWTGSGHVVGTAVDPLVLEFTAPPTPTDAGQPLSWTRTVTAASAGGSITATDTVTLPVLKDIPPNATVFANTSANGATEPGGTTDVVIGVSGSGFTDPGRTVQISASLPAGWHYVSRAGPDPWTCAPSGQLLTCTRTADFGGAPRSAVTVTIGASATAAIGPQTVTFTGTVSGADAGAATTADVTIAVNAGGAPVVNVRRWTYPAGADPALVTDGAPVAVPRNVKTIIGFDLENTGGGAITSGTTLALSVELPLGATAEAAADPVAVPAPTDPALPSPAAPWVCTNAPALDAVRATCTTTTTQDIAVSAASTQLRLAVVVPDTAVLGPALWPLTTSATLTGTAIDSLAGSTVVAVDVVAAPVAAPALGLTTVVQQTAVAGGRAGLLQVTAANVGTAAMKAGWTFSIFLPSALTPTQAQGLDPACAYAPGITPALVCSSAKQLAAGASAKAITIPINASAGKTRLTLDLTGSAAGASIVHVSTTMTVLPSGVPSGFTANQPAGAKTYDAPSVPTVGIRLASFVTSSAPKPAETSSGTGSWTWTVPPLISNSDVPVGTPGVAGEPTIGPGPVSGSRVRLLNFGTYVWQGLPEDAPTDTIVGVQWLDCDFNGNCNVAGTASTYINTGAGDVIKALVTISGTNGAGPVSTSETYILGALQAYYGSPTVLVPPSITGTPDLATVLVGHVGQYTMEFAPLGYQWLRCTGSTPATCAPIGGANGTTYTVQPADFGLAIRFQVTAGAREPNPRYNLVVTTSAVRAAVVIACGSACYTWSVQPTINHDGLGGATPLSGLPATLTNDGTYAWIDPTSAPSQVVSTVAWFTCDPANPASCTRIGTGRTVTPPTAGANLEARLTISGSFAEDGSVRTGTLVVPFGTVGDGSTPPTATTPPSISGTTYVGDVLTADPGMWSGSPSTGRLYNWLRCAATAPVCIPVGVTTATYTVQDADQTFPASVMRVDVSAPGYVNPGTARSAPTALLTGYHKRLITPPSVDGGVTGPRAGVAATATQAVWSEMPATTSGPSFEWQVCTSTDPNSCFGPVGGVTGPTYTPIQFFAGRYLRVRSVIAGEAQPSGALTVTADSALIGPILDEVVPVTASTDLAGGATSVANSTTVTVHGSGSGFGALQYSWTQTSGSSVVTNPVTGSTLGIVTPGSGSGTLGFTLTVTDSRANSMTTSITIEYGNTGVPPELCQAIALAGTPGFKTVTYGRFQINFVSSTLNNATCNASSVLTLNPSSVVAFGWLMISLTTVTISTTGVVIEGGFAGFSTGTSLDGQGIAIPSGASLSIPFTGHGDYEMVGALVGGLPGFATRLFNPWTGSTRIAFANAGGVQTITYSGEGWDSTYGGATDVAGQLPVPPRGSPVLTIVGTIGTDKTYSMFVRATGLVKFADSGIDFSGTIRHSSPTGATVFTATGALAAPLKLAAGIVLQSATLSWDGTTFTGNGALALTTGGTTLNIAAGFSFTDPKHWQASMSVAGIGSWTPVSGLTFTNPTATGNISRSPDGTQFAFAIGATAVIVAGGVALTNPQFFVNGNCPSGSSCALNLALSSGITISMFGSSLTATVTGALNTGTGAFTAQASIGAFTIAPGLSFDSAYLHVDKGSAGLNVYLGASVIVLGRVATLNIAYSNAGAIASVELGSWTPFAGSPALTNAYLVYSSYATRLTLGGHDVGVGANTLQFASDSGVPTWFSNLIGDSTATARVTGIIGLVPLTFSLSARFSFNRIQVFSVGGVALHVDAVTLELNASASGFTAVIEGNGTLTIPSIGSGAAVDLPVAVGMSFLTTTFTVAGSITLTGSGGSPAWSNAFGVSGLDVHQLSVTFGIGLGAGGVSLGFGGSVTLPASWGSQIGIQPNAVITLAAQIAGPSSCFGVEINTANGTGNVLDVGGAHALTARHASLYIAPTGCTIGTTRIAAGLALSFDGAILGLNVKANLAITPVPLTINASIALGDISVQSLMVKNATVTVNISPTAKSLTFSADATVFGVTATVRGSFQASGSVSIIDFSGTLASPNFGGFQLNNLTVNFHYVSAPQSLTMTSHIAVAVLGSTANVDLAFTIVNGAVTSAQGTAALALTVGSLTINGTGTFAFSTSSFPTIRIDGTASVGGRSLTTVSAYLQPGALQFSADLNVGGIFTSVPRLSGFVAWRSTSSAALPSIMNASGALVQAVPGDFRFDASNIALTVSGFSLSGNVSVGRVSAVVFANISTRLDLGLDRYGGLAVSFSGSFDSSGNVSLFGTGTATIGGIYGIQLTFALSRQNGVFSISGSGTIAIPDIGSVAISGSFTRDPSLGTLYQLNGTVNLHPAGYDFGSASFSAYRVAYGGRALTGMQADVHVDIANLFSGLMRMAVYSNGHFEATAYLATKGSLASALGSPQAYVYFRHANSDTFTFSLSVSDVMKIPGSFTLSGSIASGGSYDVSASVSLGPWSGSSDWGICTAYYSAQGSLSVRIQGGGSTTFSIAVTVSGSADAGCGSIGAGVGFAANFKYTAPSTFSLSVSVNLSFGRLGSWNPTVYSA